MNSEWYHIYNFYTVVSLSTVGTCIHGGHLKPSHTALKHDSALTVADHH